MKLPVRIGLLFLITGILVSTLPVNICLAASASVTVNGGNTINLGTGQSGSASVSIGSLSGFAPGNGIGAFTFELSWDSSVINVTSVDAGSYTAGVPSGGGVTIAGYSATPLTSGTTVATLQFTAVGSPGTSTTIDVSIITMVDKDGVPISGSTAGAPVNILQQHTLTMDVSPAGAGVTSPSVGAHTFNEGQVVGISASPESGWAFSHWEGDAANPSSQNTSVTMTEDKSATAVFVEIPLFTLTMGMTGQGTITPPQGLYEHPQGEVVAVTAEPAEGWRFVNWIGGVANPTAASTTVTMNSDKTIIANFSPRDSFALTILIEGSGTTNPASGTHTYARDAVVTVTATPATGYKFDGWEGDVASPSSATTTVTISTDKTITARFIAVTTFKLTISVAGSGTTDPAPGSYDYPEGTVVTIRATAGEGQMFTGWAGEVAGLGDATTTVLMDKAKMVTANFVVRPLPPTPPQFMQIAVLPVTRTEAVIFWQVDKPVTGRLEYWLDGTAVKETHLVVNSAIQHMLQLEGLEAGKTYHFLITAIDASGGETVSLENTFATAYNDAAFIITGWEGIVEETGGAKKVTINLTVANTGDLPGGYGVTLRVNGVVEETRNVTLEPGAESSVSFVTTCAQVGPYAIDVNGFAMNVEVFPPKKDPIAVPVPDPLPGQIGGWVKDHWILVLGIAAGVVLLLVLVALVIRRYYHVMFTAIRR